MNRSFETLAFVVVASVGLIAVAGLVGAKSSSSHVTTSSAFFPQPVDSVWAAVVDIEHWATWRTDLVAAERLPDRHGHPVWNQVSDRGSWPLEVIDRAPNQRFSTQVADVSQGFGGTWVYRFAAENGGTRLAITEHSYVANPFHRFWVRFVFGIHGTSDAYLKALGTRFGDSVKVTHVL